MTNAAEDKTWELIISVLKEKRAYDDRVQRTNYVSAASVRSYTLLLENEMELQANYKQGQQMKPGDRVAFYKLTTKNGFGDFYNFRNGANSKPSPLLSNLFGATIIVGVLALAFVLWADLPERFMSVFLASFTLFVGLVGFLIERSNFAFMDKRHREFLKLLKTHEQGLTDGKEER